MTDTKKAPLPTVPCKGCGKPHRPGGYAHPTKCFFCAPDVRLKRRDR